MNALLVQQAFQMGVERGRICQATAQSSLPCFQICRGRLGPLSFLRITQWAKNRLGRCIRQKLEEVGSRRPARIAAPVNTPDLAGGLSRPISHRDHHGRCRASLVGIGLFLWIYNE